MLTSLQTYASPNVDLLHQLGGGGNSTCLFATLPHSSHHPPRPHHLYSCSTPPLRLQTLSHYIASRMRTQSTPAATARIIRARHMPLSAPLFQSLSRAPLTAPQHTNSSHSSAKSLHIVVVGDSIDAFFHYRNRCAVHPSAFLLINMRYSNAPPREVLHGETLSSYSGNCGEGGLVLTCSIWNDESCSLHCKTRQF